jgi:DNA-binding CsgD family transcriptional regulator
MSAQLGTDRVRQLIRLIAECREIQHADRDASLHWLGGLARITRSQVAAQIQATGMHPEAAPRIGEVRDVGWTTQSDRDRVYGFVTQTKLNDDPLTAALVASKDCVTTRTRAETISSAAWARSLVRNEVHRPSGIDDSLLSVARLPGDHARVLAFKRAWGEQPYGPEEREIVHLAHGECSWLFGRRPAVSAALTANWSRRERETLDLLLTGASEKTAAARLGVSPHTLHGYVKAIYRRLGVASRPELMARALSRSSPEPAAE